MSELSIASLSEADRESIKEFSCGDESWAEDLNDFLRNDALQDQERNFNRTYLFYAASETCVGFATLLASEVKEKKGRIFFVLTREKVRYSTVPAVLIGRIAVREDFQGRGIGGQILAWVRNLARELPIGCRFLALDVDRNNSDAIRFYEREGFLITPVKPGKNTKLMLYDLIYSDEH